MTDKEQYEAALKTQSQVTKFIDTPRCINCDNFSATGECTEYRTSIEPEYMYTPNECEKWSPLIPF